MLSVASLLWTLQALRTRHDEDRRRYIVALDARLWAADGTACAVRVTNLSRLGAQVSLTETSAAAGDTVTLALGAASRPARIVWRKADTAGLVFDRRLPPGDVVALTRRATGPRPDGRRASA
ncbi:hypothetical protein EAT49_08575 [Histidinibacterium lentulum]|uniref:PilZ domain-containing protein n=1 Tax=Histidinibacterium lentulum TaxID=2480588 RepID=A0A3N2R4S2_9RHOB|nr:hypothetical protein EAT49_08575 [Histidinibacterium lentulum]